MNKLNTQKEWIEKARQVLPAGGFGNFDHNIIISRGNGSHVWDEDGREYVDYLIGSGPMLVGHGHPEVLEVVLARNSLKKKENPISQKSRIFRLWVGCLTSSRH